MLAAVAGLLLAIAAGSALFSLRLQNALVEKTEQLWQAKLKEARSLRRSNEVDSRGRALAALKDAANLRVTPELRGETCLRLHKYGEAVAEFSAVIRNAPRFDSFTWRSRAYTYLKDYGNAAADLRTALQMNSKSPVLNEELAAFDTEWKARK
jgi:hypothetical protein